MSNHFPKQKIFINIPTRVLTTRFRACLGVLIVCLSTMGHAFDSRAIPDQTQLEIAALTAILGDKKRVVKRYHRAIVKYREVLAEIEQKRAEQNGDRTISIGNVAPLMNMNRLMERRTPHERRLIARIIQGNIDLDFLISAPSQDELYMEEMVVIGNSFEKIPLDPAEFSVAQIKQMRGSRSHANDLYADGHYDDAYPLLLELAKRGFKDSQSRLAYILFTGTERVEKSNLRALGWLASAAYGDSEPMFRVLFKRYMAEVPESVRPTVNEVVSRYQEAFAFDEHQNCSTEHPFAYGVVKRTYCRFDLETIADACRGNCWAHNVNVEAP